MGATLFLSSSLPICSQTPIHLARDVTMPTIIVPITSGVMTRFKARFREEWNRMMEQAAAHAPAIMAEETIAAIDRERTGRLANMVDAVIVGDGLRLIWNAPYASYVELGVPRHTKVAGSKGGGPYMSWPGAKYKPYKGDKYPGKIIAESVESGFRKRPFARRAGYVVRDWIHEAIALTYEGMVIT